MWYLIAGLVVGAVLEYRYGVCQRVIDLASRIFAAFMLVVVVVLAVFSGMADSCMECLRRLTVRICAVWRWIVARPWAVWVGFALRAGVVIGVLLLFAWLLGHVGWTDQPYAPPTETAEGWQWLLVAILLVFVFIATVMWNIVTGVWTGIALLLKLLLAGIIWLAVVLAASCTTDPVIEPQAVPVLQHPLVSGDIELQPRKGEGLIHVTRRSEFPLSLGECVEAAKRSGMTPVRNARGFLEAPRLYESDRVILSSGRWEVIRK